MMSLHLALPREGHLDQVLQIFAYLKKYHNTELVYDPSGRTINYAEFEKRDWESLEFRLTDGKEELPPKMPEPRGMGCRNLNQIRTDRRTVELRFSWECVLITLE